MAAGGLRWFDIRPGEGKALAGAAGTLFVIIAGHIMLETARDALFLGSLEPSRLPWVYAILSVFVLVALSLNGRLVRRFGRRNALIATLMVAGYGTVLLYLLPRSPAIIFGIYLWSALLGTVLVVQFWMLAGLQFTVSQGKRLFGPLAAAGAMGAVVGASAAAAIVQLWPVDALLMCASGLFLATGLVLTAAPDPVQTTTPSLRAGEKKAARRLLSSLQREPYLRRLAVMLFIATATFLFIDYLFKSVAARSISPDNLGTFFASYYAIVTAVGLVFQLLISARIVSRVGLLAAVAITPLLLLASAGGVIVLGGLVAMVLVAKGVDGALRHSLHRVSLELLWMPISAETKESAKGAVDGVLVRIAQAVAAAALFALATLQLDSPRILGAIVGGLALIWALTAVSLRTPYLTMFRNALSRRAVDVQGDLDVDSAEVLVEALSSLDSVRVSAAIDLLAEKGRTRLIPSLILYHDSPDVVVKALQVIATPGRRDWIPLTRRSLLHESPDVRVEAMRALARNDLQPELDDRLSDISPTVRAHAAFWVAQIDENADKHQLRRIRDLLAIGGKHGHEAKVALCDAIAMDGNSDWAGVLLELIQSDDPTVVEAAATATPRVQDPRFIDILIQRLGIRNGRSSVRSAIGSLGEPALAALQTAFEADDTPHRIRLHIPRTISSFRNQAAADYLAERLNTESSGQIRYKILRSLTSLAVAEPLRINREVVFKELRRNMFEYFRLLSLCVPIAGHLHEAPESARQSGDLLVSLLEDKERQALQRIFVLLQLAHRDEDVRSLYFALTGGDKNQRAKALEFIDVLTRSPFYNSDQAQEVAGWLRLLGEDLPPPEKLARAGSAVASPPATANDALVRLLQDPDSVIASITAFHAIERGQANLASDIIRRPGNTRALNALGRHAEQLKPAGGSSASG